MATQAEAANHHFTLLIRELRQPLVNALGKIIVLQQLARIRRAIIRQGVQQGFIRIRTQRDIDRRHALIQAKHALDLPYRFFQQVGDLFRRRFMIEFLCELSRCPQVDVELFDHMDRQPDRAGLIHDRPFDGLANPPGGIG